MNKFFKIILPLVAIGAGLLIKQALMATAPELGEQEITTYVPRINVMPAVASSHQIAVQAFGVVQMQGNVALISKVSGELLTINDKLRSGTTFDKGEILATVDSSDFAQSLVIAESAETQATAKLVLEQAAAELAIRDWQRVSDEVPSAVTARQPQLDLAMATLHAASAQVALAKSNLERCTLLAPFNGHTLKLNTEVGQWLNPGTVIAALLPSDGTEVNIPLNAQQLQLLGLPASGKCAPLKVRLRLPNQPHELDAHLIRISNELEQGTRMNQAVALLPSGIIVPPQTYLEMTILGDSIANTFSLPAVAVNGKYAQVVDSASTLHEIELTIIQQLENSYIVRGLNAGQQVSTTPVSVFVPGMQVAVINN